MSGEHSVDGVDDAGREDRRTVGAGGAVPTTIEELRGTDRATIVQSAGLAAALAVTIAAAVRILRNLPTYPVAVPDPAHSFATVGVPIVVGVALVAVALASDLPSTRVGLCFAGVFAPMAAIDSAASLPAVGAVVAGGGLGVLGAIGRPDSRAALVPLGVTSGFLAAIVVSLAASTAVIDGGHRPLGAALCLLAIGALAVRTEGDRTALLSGVVAGLLVLAAAEANPFAAGGALLAGFAVTGVPFFLVGVAIAGGVAALVAGLRRREPALVAGSVLVLLAGMPTTAPRVSAIVLGVALAVVGPERLAAVPDHSDGDRPVGQGDPQ